MNRVKTDSRAGCKESLNSLNRIRKEGQKLKDYNHIPAIQLWASPVTRRPNQTKRKSYRPQEAAKKSKVLIDHFSTDDSTDKDKDIDVLEDDSSSLFSLRMVSVLKK
ncbi:hypothetical protein ACROYT_G015347 [Oculina patagonica]